MLTHPAAYILRRIKRLTGSTETPFDWYDGDTEFTLGERSTIGCTRYAGELHGIVDFLIRQGYLAKDGEMYHLTHEGLHYRRIRFLEIRDFFYRSILTPIAVSFVTTVITICLTK